MIGYATKVGMEEKNWKNCDDDDNNPHTECNPISFMLIENNQVVKVGELQSLKINTHT